jgi:hypothetical protein
MPWSLILVHNLQIPFDVSSLSNGLLFRRYLTIIIVVKKKRRLLEALVKFEKIQNIPNINIL